ncbi:MAG TPA: 50S ribosomal protein L23 [Candidatus Peregrinibacteria bacterium]|nr:50S ribosomal protein L23 [Candidatus Peregrinibacteria bacterium]
MDLAQVIIAPVVTEKSHGGQTGGKYTFKVNKRANKIEVKQAVEKYYGIAPLAVNILSTPVKKRLVSRGREVKKRKAYKKAIITLPKGKSLDITRLVKKEKKK